MAPFKSNTSKKRTDAVACRRDRQQVAAAHSSSHASGSMPRPEPSTDATSEPAAAAQQPAATTEADTIGGASSAASAAAAASATLLARASRKRPALSSPERQPPEPRALPASPPPLLPPPLLPLPSQTAAAAQELLGRYVDVPWTVWGGEYAISAEISTGMIVKYDGRPPPTFTIKFGDATLAPLRCVTWAQVHGSEPYAHGRLALCPSAAGPSTLAQQPRGKPPSAADCWDMRRGEWVRADGSAVTAMSKVDANQGRTVRRQTQPQHRVRHQQWRRPGAASAGATSSRAWLIPGGDIDAWRWDGVEALEALPGPGREHERLLHDWRVKHGDLFVGPLGGCDNEHRCAHCNAPLFRGETRTKCCVGAGTHGGELEADWYGPFCSYPYIPQPEGAFRALWYGTDERAKHFLASTRPYNCRYAFSSLHATRLKRKGKPVFQLRGAVYYRIAPAMVPPSKYQPDYAQLYTLDADAGFDERLRRLLAATTSSRVDADDDAGSDDGEDDHRPATAAGRREPAEQRRIRSTLPIVNVTMHANPLAQQYKRAFDEARDAPTARLKLHVEPGQIPPGGAAAGAHERQYNAPTAENVAVILHAPSDDSQLDVIIHPRLDDAPNRLQRVSYSHALYDALAFPLYFWKGTPTWHMDFKVKIRGSKQRGISMMEFYASMLYVRRSAADMPRPRAGVKRHADAGKTIVNENTWFFRGGRLFQQFVCTAAARYELKRMSTLATPTMQKKLRAETYDQLMGALHEGEDPANIGRRVICPASVKGSRRAMYKLFLDCMAIVRKFGSPHLFITVTCNQGHRDIKASLLDGQYPDERADVVNRYFAKQIDLLLEYIEKGEAFGALCAYCYVIEYQKRGNPHMHMVIRLKDGPRSPEQYDEYVSARLPPGPPRGDEETGECLERGCCCRDGQPIGHCGCGAAAGEPCSCDSVLWHAVLQHMTHVCGDDAPCRDSTTGRCRYLYDEDRYTPVTLHAAKKRPQYKRISPDAPGGRFAYKSVRGPGGSKMKVKITDSQVVPHNPRLLLAPVGFEYMLARHRLDSHEDQLIVQRVLKRHGARDAWHSNVEISSNPTSNIKYLYLYFCKGEDRVICSVADDDEEDVSSNECKQHLNGQHHSPESSVWKLLGLKMNRQSHRCELLMLSYPGKEYVRFDASAGAEDVEASAEEQAGKNHTKAFFEINAFEADLRFDLDADHREQHGPVPTGGSLTITGEPSSDPPASGRRAAYLGTDAATTRLHPPACRLKYEDVPYFYTYDGKHARWRRRKAPYKDEKLVTRIAVIRPSSGDIFYMRLRLLYDCCKGCRSYDDLRTPWWHDEARRRDYLAAGGSPAPCDSFQQACIVEGLVADDSEWREALLEGVGLKCGKALRSLFVEILMNCEPQKPAELWDEFKDDLADDIAHENGRGEPNGTGPSASDYNEALRRIRDELQDFPAPKTLADFDLPAVDESDVPASSEVAEIRAERLLHENREAELLARYQAKLGLINEGQRSTWACLKADIDEVKAELASETPPSRARAHFIYARGGFGKTFLDELILDYTRGHKGFALAMASSGIAALLLEGARTVHSRCKVPLEITEGQMLNFSKHHAVAKLIKRAVLLLWDECTMLSKEVLEIIDRSLRDLTGNNLSFGGKLFIFTGDWAQCLPVAKNRHATVTSTHLQSELWERFTQHELIVNERVRQCRLRGEPSQAAKYAKWDAFLSDVGAGALGEGVISCDGTPHDASKLIRLPNEIVFESQELSAFVDFIYPDVAANYTDAAWLTQRAILTPKNEDVDAINAEVLSRLPGEELTFLSADETTDDTSGIWSTETLNNFDPTGMPPHELKLKVGCVLMLLRNLHATRGLCNGTRLILEGVKRRVLICRILTGRKDRIGMRVVIPRIKLHSAKGELPCTLTRLQFPVRVAFGMTINKSQGQTLPFVGIYLPRPVFGHGQLYVGLGRVGDPSCIKVLVVDSREQGRFEGRDGVWTVNIVYPEVLADARRLLLASLASRGTLGASASGCAECDGEGSDDESMPAAPPPLAAAGDEADELMPDADAGQAAADADDADDADAAVEAAIERHVFAPLRRSARHVRVPDGLLSRQQAWSLAHASELTASTQDEMVDPWDAASDDGEGDDA